MLENFFRLNNPYKTMDGQAFEDHLKVSNDLRNVFYEPDALPVGRSKIEGIKFENVSLSKTNFAGVTFKKCEFKDCLFVGCNFDGVEFHSCSFKDCNFYKAKFSGCYLDPKCITFSNSYRKTHSNIAVSLYQGLLENSSKEKQTAFERDADIRFRRWQRDQLRFSLNDKKINALEYSYEVAANFVYSLVSGYGYKPGRFVLTTVILFTALSAINVYALSGSIQTDGVIVHSPTFADSVFYTYSMMTALGFSSITPVSAFSKVYSVAMAFMGIGWLGIFTSMLVKRFLK